jgi:hypothetical protein
MPQCATISDLDFTKNMRVNSNSIAYYHYNCPCSSKKCDLEHEMTLGAREA